MTRRQHFTLVVIVTLGLVVIGFAGLLTHHPRRTSRSPAGASHPSHDAKLAQPEPRVPASGANLFVRVLAAGSMKPVEGAVVKVYDQSKPDQERRLRTDRSGALQATLEPGTYILTPSLVDEGPEGRSAELEGDSAQATIRSLGESVQITLFVSVPPTVTVEGVCLNSEGQGLHDVEVLVCADAPDRATKRAFQWASTKSAQNGEFRITARLRPGEYYVSTFSDSMEGIDGDDEGLRFTVFESPESQTAPYLRIVHRKPRAFNVIRGKVIDELDRPVSDARIEIKSPRLEFLDYPVVFTGSNGMFECKGEGHGEAEIVVRHAKYATARHPIGFINPSEVYVIKLTPKAIKIVARILDRNGRPMREEDVRVEIMEWVRGGGLQVNPIVPVIRTPDGGFEFYADSDKYYTFDFMTNPDTVGSLKDIEEAAIQLRFSPDAQKSDTGRYSFSSAHYQLEVIIPK